MFYDVYTEPIVKKEKYRVRSLFDTPKVFDNFNDASVYYESMFEMRDYDMLIIEEETDAGWKEIEMEEVINNGSL